MSRPDLKENSHSNPNRAINKSTLRNGWDEVLSGVTVDSSKESGENRSDLSGRELDDRCEINFVDQIKALRVKENTKPDRVIMSLAETFKVLGDPTRLKILFAIALEELCVCDLAHLLNMTESAISHQLRLLRNLKIVKHRKEGKMVYYSLDDGHVASLLREASEHSEHIGE